ncbi:CDP-glucose 4,6-dehydratase [Fontibacillus phaseoli]|uniref:CDP-glucose 4,6-dehydratase n=1 Tax=Fontibacillus phaseoli TaxID=1416533 RepID=A0A369BC72_9BACL|nr:CDP-glucose 4,6-dehydratase [Fontibacillus phaseoli]RCX19011.1 CDP-glucose 4,6-dehydratase [Fontibacillus phaseoli]
MIDANFWKDKKVFITGHTGFKGSWLSIWLTSLGANVTGYSLNPTTNPNLFELADIEALITRHVIADIRDRDSLLCAMQEAQPEIVIHMAAQPLVRESYKNPVDTYATNVMGTVNLFESVRSCESVSVVVNVTTDKCYDNKEWVWGYREDEPLGGYDPYSSSKACSELVTSAYRNSFFNNPNERFVAVASARAGNVIGGGDWAEDRLVPDCIRSILTGDPVILRNPNSIRPWQHVLEPLSGYLLLAQSLYQHGREFSSAWNFGPHDEDAKPVEWIVRKICEKWGRGASFDIDASPQPHEAHFLKLDCSKAITNLKWSPRWDLDTAIDKIIEFTKVFEDDKTALRGICLAQINEYQNS